MSRKRVVLADLLLTFCMALWVYVFDGCKGPHLLILIFPIMLLIPAVSGCIKMHTNYYKLTKKIY